MNVSSRLYRYKWIKQEKWKDADWTDAILFLATECNELAKECIEAAIRGQNYTRNNNTKKGTKKAIVEEIGGVLLMSERIAELLGLTLDDIYLYYLKTMDEKRKG